MAASVKHSNETNEQYTPIDIIERARKVMGSIDTDPATSELANSRVQAPYIFTRDDGERTFEEHWHGNVFLNPPGGRDLVLTGTGLNSNPAIFWAKLMHAWHKERTARMGIVIGFTIEVLQSSQGVEKYPMLRFPLCIPAKRLAFDVPREEKIRQLQDRLLSDKIKDNKRKLLEKKIAQLEGSDEQIVTGEDPPHGNVIVCVPPIEEHMFGVAVPWDQPDEPERPWVGWTGPVVRKFQDVFSEIGYVRI